MKNIILIQILLAATFLSSCNNDDSPIPQPGTNGALAAWVSEPDGRLKLSDPSAEVDFEIEFSDQADGSSVEAFTTIVTDGTNTANLYNETSFSINENGKQGFVGQFNLNDVFTVLGTDQSDYEEGDTLKFKSTITFDGATVPNGTSQNSVRDFEMILPKETLNLTGLVVDSKHLNNFSTEKVVLAFANDLTVGLEVLPTVVSISEGGFNDDIVGPIQVTEDEDGEDSVYYFNYTPGIAASDIISFRITNASAVSTPGFEMADSVVSDVFVIDNLEPTIVGNNTAPVLDDAGMVKGHRFNYLLDEEIGSVTLTYDFRGVDDDEDGEVDETDEEGDAVEVEVTFTKNVFDYTFDWDSEEGEVTLTLEIKDLAGNPLNLGAESQILLTP